MRKTQKLKHFLVVLIAFLVLGISFKVMVLVEGLTEVRPVNALPPVAGLVCGPVGALACGIGNLLADLVGTFSKASVLGVAANFLAAYLPYRLWYLFSKESPNLHGGKQMLLYTILSLAAALTAAWVLAFGFLWVNGVWMKEIYTYVFYNNFGFSIGLGMPILIILTSPDVRVQCCEPPRSLVPKHLRYLQKTVFGMYLGVLLFLMLEIMVLRVNPSSECWLHWLSLAALAGLLLLLV